MGIRRVAGLAWNRLLMRVDSSTGKGLSGIDKFSSKVHRVHMELGGKLPNSLRIKTQFLERLQSVNVVDGAGFTSRNVQIGTGMRFSTKHSHWSSPLLWPCAGAWASTTSIRACYLSPTSSCRHDPQIVGSKKVGLAEAWRKRQRENEQSVSECEWFGKSLKQSNDCAVLATKQFQWYLCIIKAKVTFCEHAENLLGGLTLNFFWGRYLAFILL